MCKNVTIFLLALLATALTCGAQVPDKGDSTRWDFHASIGGAAMSGFGHTQALTWAAPWASYKANDRLTLHGGLVAAGTLLPNNFELQGRGDRSLAPRREGTRAGALWAAADYKANDNLRLWAAVAVARGWMQPLWAGESMPLAATAVDGGFAYRFDGGSVLAMHFSFVHDRYGTLAYPPYMGYPHYYGLMDSPLARDAAWGMGGAYMGLYPY